MRIDRTRVAVRRCTRLCGARAARLYEEARRHRQRLVAAAIALGILVMVIHWR